MNEVYVLHLHKGAEKEDPNNYWPISISPSTSKIFERHLSNQLLSFLNKQDSLAKHNLDLKRGILVKQPLFG